MKQIILMSIDSLRFDALSCEQDARYLRRYGLEETRHTPVLDGLAAEGVRIRQAISAAPYTTASHASMFTGYYPPRHGVRAFLKNELPRSIRTLAERLRGHGYRTIGTIDLADIFRIVKLTRGFDEVIKYDDRGLFALLEGLRAQPLFLFAHFEDVHWPFGESPCPPFDGYNDDVHEAEVRCAQELGLAPAFHGPLTRPKLLDLGAQVLRDCEVRGLADTVMFPRYLTGVNKFDGGRLKVFMDCLRGLGMLDDSLLIITGDHGEAPLPARKRADRWVPMRFSHGESVIEELIRVPLIVRAPGRLAPGRVLDVQVSLADLAPTILDYAGLRGPADCDGVSLRGLLEGRQAAVSAGAYSEGWYHDGEQFRVALQRSKEIGRVLGGADTFLFQATLRTPRYKYVETGSELTVEEMALPDVEFARALLRKLLGCADDPAARGAVMSALQNGTSREALVAEFRDRQFHRRALYDLTSDPYEDVNLLGVDLGQGALGGEGRYSRIAEGLARRLGEIQRAQPAEGAERATEGLSARERKDAGGRPEESGGQGDEARRLRLELDLVFIAEPPPDPVEGTAPEPRSQLERAAALGSLGDLVQMQAQLLTTLQKDPELIRLPAARMDIARIAYRLAMASASPVDTTRVLCAEIAQALRGLTGHGRAWKRQALADIWTEIALPLGFGWDGCCADVRGGSRAAAWAIRYDPARLRRGGLLWLVARGLIGRRLADPIRALFKRVQKATTG